MEKASFISYNILYQKAVFKKNRANTYNRLLNKDYLYFNNMFNVTYESILLCGKINKINLFYLISYNLTNFLLGISYGVVECLISNDCQMMF